MPTDTFFRLPEEKRARLMAAIYQELSKNPFSKLSINRIVKTAGISRGSYYQYFADMDDLYGYMIDDHKARIVEGLCRLCAEEKGDLFAAAPRLFDEAVDYFRATDNLNLIKSLFLELHEREASIFPSEYGHDAWFDSILPFVNQRNLRFDDENAFRGAMMMILGTLIGSVIKVLNGTPAAEARAELLRNLDWLQYGMKGSANDR